MPASIGALRVIIYLQNTDMRSAKFSAWMVLTLSLPAVVVSTTMSFSFHSLGAQVRLKKAERMIIRAQNSIQKEIKFHNNGNALKQEDGHGHCACMS